MTSPKFLILTGHPIPNSFNAALAKSYNETLKEQPVQTRVLDLSQMDFDPNLQEKNPSDIELTGDLAKFWEALVWADHFVLVHPLWWGSMPAKLKGLFDITLQSGKAYRYDKGNPFPIGLLKGRSAHLIVTSDTPNWFMRLSYKNAHFNTMKNQILKYCGFGPVQITHISPIRGKSAEERSDYLKRVTKLAKKAAQKALGKK